MRGDHERLRDVEDGVLPGHAVLHEGLPVAVLVAIDDQGELKGRLGCQLVGLRGELCSRIIFYMKGFETKEPICNQKTVRKDASYDRVSCVWDLNCTIHKFKVQIACRARLAYSFPISERVYY